jgi:hypothetical protein
MALAGAAALSAGAFAFTFDAQIMIERALNSPTLTVKYDGASASLVELLVNGQSVATRTVTASASKGETTFTLTISDLKDGENELEIRLLDKTGKIISTQKQTMLNDAANKGPVYINSVKQGATVQGGVEIKVGFGKELKNAFVSFFVDGDYKSVTNVAPFSYYWDSAKESNGWHTVEAWVVDESTNTYKSKPVRVFVNNPGGRTNRAGLGTGEAVVSKGTSKPEVQDTDSSTKKTDVSKPSPVTTVIGATTPSVKPADTTPTEKPAEKPAVKVVDVKVNDTKPALSHKPVAAKVESRKDDMQVATLGNPVPMGSQDMTPTGMRLASNKNILSNVPDRALESARKAFNVEHGTRFTGVTSFSVMLNNRFVEFDVAPRVDDGVPMTPFRHLIEKNGGKVDWTNAAKIVDAMSNGDKISFKIGDKNAKINDRLFDLEMAPYLDRGRAIVPLSFFRDVFKDMNIEFDPATGHVLITKK